MPKTPASAQYRKVLDHIGDVIYTLSPEGIITSLNHAFETLTGWPSSEWTGRSYQALIHPEDLPTVLSKFQRLLQGESPPRSEVRIATCTGHYKIIECLETADTKGTGIIGVLGIARDITERRQAEEALRESEERFRQVVETIREVFWMSDPGKERMLYVSPGYEQIWGRTCESLYRMPRSWMDSIHPEDRPRVLEASMSKQALGTYDELYRILRPDGTARWIHDRAFPIRNVEGTVYRITGIAEDVTERTLLEEQIHNSNDALTNLTSRLQTIREEERARISQDLHDELGQALAASKFTLHRMDDALTSGRFVNALITWQARLQSVIQDMDAALTTVQRICLNLRPAALDQLGLNAALEQQVKDFTNRTGISCDTTLQMDDSKLRPDQATALFRVLQEALSNIARHASATRATISLTEEMGHAKLQVQDNGIGIRRSDIDHPHSLGLLGIRERVRPLRGALQIIGAQGKGTTVTVLLPFAAT